MLMGSSYQKLKDKVRLIASCVLLAPCHTCDLVSTVCRMQLLGLGRDIQASDPADLEYNVVKPLVGEA